MLSNYQVFLIADIWNDNFLMIRQENGCTFYEIEQLDLDLILMSNIDLAGLSDKIQGELFTDNLHKILYATDASVYRELPLGVVYPRDAEDVAAIVRYCNTHAIPIIPRAGGTSLAGQCVGNGLVVDVSRHMINVIEIDAKAKTAIVQPGIIRDQLNHLLKEHGLMVGPNTSTANRAMIGR